MPRQGSRGHRGRRHSDEPAYHRGARPCAEPARAGGADDEAEPLAPPAAAALRWDGELRDRALEAAYRREEARPPALGRWALGAAACRLVAPGALAGPGAAVAVGVHLGGAALAARRGAPPWCAEALLALGHALLAAAAVLQRGAPPAERLLSGALCAALLPLCAPPPRAALLAPALLAPGLLAVADAAAPGGDASLRGALLLLATCGALLGAHVRLGAARRAAFCARREAVAELRARAAEAARRARSRLIRCAMHSLRSPLLSASQLADGLASDGDGAPPSADDARESARGLRACMARMQRVVDELLAFEQLDAGRLRLCAAPLSVGALLEGALREHGARAAAKGVALRAELLPRALRGSEHVGDARRLRQCLDHGVANALEFTEAGGSVTLRAAARAGKAGDCVCVEVVDTGCGLSAAELRALRDAEPFSRVGRGQLRGSAGAGLGIAVVRRLLALHGGCLRVHSDGPGRGATFGMHLVLPRAEAAAEAGAAPAPSPPARLRFPADFRVLYAEDDALLRRTVQLKVLHRLGVPHDVAEDGAAALRLAAAYAYSLVLLDNQMPTVTGEQAARALRARGYDGLIVGMTGDPSGCAEREAFEAAGLDACLDKDSAGVRALVAALERCAQPPPAADADGRAAEDEASKAGGGG